VHPPSYQRALRRAETHLAGLGAPWGPHLRRFGRAELAVEPHFEPFHALLSAIAHQQLTGKAAQTILSRVKDRYGKGGWPSARTLNGARIDALRRCGLSNAKARAVKDLAAKRLDGTVPGAKALHALDDEAIVERLTQVRGVGRWTVEMLLIFRLGRLDVLPVDDYGVLKGYTRLYGLKELATKKALLAAGEAWRPYRSVASWYLWRAAD